MSAEHTQAAEKDEYVLFVEDDNFLSSLVIKYLEEDGIPFVLAVTGEEGLAAAKKRKPALVLLDIILPGIDGYEVLHRLKNDPILLDIPVIILSNLGQKEEKERAKQLGAADFLIKAESDLNDITKRVRSFLKGRKA